MSKNDGGPAFPVSTGSNNTDECGPYGHQSGNSTWQFPGMTMRDWFAGMAMQGSIAYSGADGLEEKWCAKWCYKMADAMLAERNKE